MGPHPSMSSAERITRSESCTNGLLSSPFSLFSN